MAFRPLVTPADLEDAFEASHRRPVVLFKHSRTCPISAHAQAVMNRLAEGTLIYRLTVQESRPLSREIADQLGIEHESPQAIVVSAGEVVSHASHYGITADWLRDELVPA